MFCYTDDILLCRFSVTGLQKMINIATEYIENHGLRFNPHKRIRHITDHNPFTTILTCSWYIIGVVLNIEHKVTYLSSILGVNGGKEHCENRCKAAHRSFYGLQGGGGGGGRN